MLPEFSESSLVLRPLPLFGWKRKTPLPDPAYISALATRIDQMEKREEQGSLTTWLGLDHLWTQPFTQRVLTVPLPEHFHQPKLDAYNRLSNPDIHL